MRKNTIFVLVIIAIFVAGFFGWRMFKTEIPARDVIDFISCAQADYPIMESYPRQCRTPDGRTFVEVIERPTGKSDLIVVDSPKPNETVKSPLVITGRARGNWFFEASFPVDLVVDDEVIMTGIAQARGDWMTTEFVPFEVKLNFEYTFGRETIPANIILKKDNPSGLPEHDDRISIPVILVPGIAEPIATCKPSGCSGQICSDEDIVTTCEFRAEYACYKNAKCERQTSGNCGWTQTPELTQCLQSPPPLQ